MERKNFRSKIRFLGTGGGTRTHDQEIKSLLLYQLSYAGSQAKVLKVSVFKLWSRRMLFKISTIFFLFYYLLNGKSSTDSISISTFSIVALDEKTGELGIAVQSKFIAVGSVVPYAKAEIGAIASQAWGNVQYGPYGLNLLRQGKKPDEVVKILIEQDPIRDHRQLAMIDMDGNASSYTGKKCLPWAGSKIGNNYSVQGNLLKDPQVIQAMASDFEKSTGALAKRLISSLKAGQEAGGDKRGKQSAAILVVRQGWGYGGMNDRFRDLRVDDHPNPINELERIYNLHRKVFPRPDTHQFKK